MQLVTKPGIHYCLISISALSPLIIERHGMIDCPMKFKPVVFILFLHGFKTQNFQMKKKCLNFLINAFGSRKFAVLKANIPFHITYRSDKKFIVDHVSKTAKTTLNFSFKRLQLKNELGDPHFLLLNCNFHAQVFSLCMQG